MHERTRNFYEDITRYNKRIKTEQIYLMYWMSQKCAPVFRCPGNFFFDKCYHIKRYNNSLSLSLSLSLLSFLSLSLFFSLWFIVSTLGKIYWIISWQKRTVSPYCFVYTKVADPGWDWSNPDPNRKTAWKSKKKKNTLNIIDF